MTLVIEKKYMDFELLLYKNMKLIVWNKILY